MGDAVLDGSSVISGGDDGDGELGSSSSSSVATCNSASSSSWDSGESGRFRSRLGARLGGDRGDLSREATENEILFDLLLLLLLLLLLIVLLLLVVLLLLFDGAVAVWRHCVWIMLTPVRFCGS